MDKKNDNVEKAIDDIFGSDFLEINVDQQNTVLEDNNGEVYVDKDNDDGLAKSPVSVPFEEQAHEPSEEFKNIFDSNDDFYFSESKKEDHEIDTSNDYASHQDDEPSSDSGKQNKTNVKMVIFFIVSILGCAFLVIAIFTFYIKNEKTVVCKYGAEDAGYTITDQYKITHTNSKIKYVEAVYKYTAKEEEYKTQIQYIREEKLPVILNSNGMPGFTYLYDQSDDYFKVSSYLDFDLFDYDKIDKNDNLATPISYITINSKTNLSSLTSELEEKGYTCEVE